MIILVCQLLVVHLISFQNIASTGSWADMEMSTVSLCRSVVYPVAGSSIFTATEIFLLSWSQWQYNCSALRLLLSWLQNLGLLFSLLFPPFLSVDTTT